MSSSLFTCSCRQWYHMFSVGLRQMRPCAVLRDFFLRCSCASFVLGSERGVASGSGCGYASFRVRCVFPSRSLIARASCCAASVLLLRARRNDVRNICVFYVFNFTSRGNFRSSLLLLSFPVPWGSPSGRDSTCMIPFHRSSICSCLGIL